ncbi:IS66 family insertion sequence element accessory protein TnpB [Sphingobium fluviale]|uniref:Transposase n=1 Tax=Sphingobium fluviale TaxID=2506423 RepID=A0A4Q1K9U9_9SPHN|nr:IS66 family insertion sequence element accessory protein TnpB [Sphingobium fluviale]RXR22800.1 transposase [Sphingobium fluviale]
MIIPPGPLKVLIATKPVDFRKGMVGLAGLVQNELRLNPFSGVLFIFRCKRSDRIKLLLWDGTGLVLVTKRLEQGQFRWPRIGDAVMKLSAAQASALVEGLDWRRVHAPRVARPQLAQ